MPTCPQPRAPVWEGVEGGLKPPWDFRCFYFVLQTVEAHCHDWTLSPTAGKAFSPSVEERLFHDLTTARPANKILAEQKLSLKSPFRDWWAPALWPRHAVSWSRPLPCPRQACKASSSFLGFTPQYSYPSCPILYNFLAPATQHRGYPCHRATTQDVLVCKFP